MAPSVVLAVFAAGFLSMAVAQPTYIRVRSGGLTARRGGLTVGNGTHAVFAGGLGDTTVALNTQTVYEIDSRNFFTEPASASVLHGASVSFADITYSDTRPLTVDSRAWAIGGATTAGVLTNTVAFFSGRSWTVLPVASGSVPSARRGAASTFLRNCANNSLANPMECVVMIGGETASGVLSNEVWFLWVGESPARWERIAAAQSNAPPASADAAISVSPDGNTLFVFGGRTAAGSSAEMYAFAIRGFTDFLLSEADNLAAFKRAHESSTDSYWGYGGPNRAVDNNLIQAHDNGPPLRACTCTYPEFNPWWKVDLLSVQRIDRVVIYPRSDCCTDRYYDYNLWFGNSNVSYSANPPFPRPYPNLGGQAVTITPATPVTGQFFWFQLPGAYTRTLTICEVQLYQKRPYIWRKLSGVTNVALGKTTSQSSIETGYSGGDSSRGVDGITSNNYGSSPFTCAATANTGVGNSAWWMVDLGGTYDVSSMTFWPRTDCCPDRNKNLNFYVGFSQDSAFNNICPGVPLDFGLASGGRTFNCPLRGRYVIITRTSAAPMGDNVLQVCELVVTAANLLDQPSPRSGMAYTSFRGYMVIYGGTAGTGFRVSDDVRLFDTVNRKWMASVVSLGTTPASRALTHFARLPNRALLPFSAPGSDLMIYAGQSNSEVLTDASILRYPSCPSFVRFGIVAENITQGGTVFFFTCGGGFTNRNGANPVICRANGAWEGLMPPCQAAVPNAPLGPSGANPATEFGVVLDPSGTAANVTYTPPSYLGYFTANGVSTYNVFASPAGDFYEDFSNNNFLNPSAWRRLAEFTTISNNHYFANGKLWLDAAAGSDYWIQTVTVNGYNAMNIPSNPTGNWAVGGDPLYRGLVLHRDWPASVDASAPWAYEALLEAGTLPTNAQLAIGMFDQGTCPYPVTSANYPAVCSGHIMFYAGLRKVNEQFYPGMEVVGSGIFGGWSPEIARSTNIYVRIEYRPTGAVTKSGIIYKYNGAIPVMNDAQTFRILYKYRAQDSWSRSPYHIDNTMMFNGTTFIPQNFRPAIIAKQWNNNIYGRSLSSVRYIRIGPIICANPGCQRVVPGNTLLSQLTGLTPGAAYKFGARAATAAGYGASASTSITYTTPTVAAPALPALVNAALRKFAWQASNYNNDEVANGAWRSVDGDFNTFSHSACGTGDWIGIDLGVNYAAIKRIVVYNRIDCCRERLQHFSFYAGQDNASPRNNNGIYARDLDPTKFATAQVNNNYYSLIDMADGVPTVGQAHGTFTWTAYGRYFYLVNSLFSAVCFNMREIQVLVANACPARTFVGAQVVTGGGRNCNANAAFGAICTLSCLPGYVQVSGSATSTCNGETWDAPQLVCQPACPDLDPPAYATTGLHEIINENFDGDAFSKWGARSVDTAEPGVLPFSQFFAVRDGVLNAFSRIGCNSDPSAIFYNEKIRAMDGNGAFTFQADVVTGDKAGLIYRFVDARNFYRVYIDVLPKLVVIEKMVNGIPILLTNTPFAAVLPDTTYTMLLSVSGPNVNVSINGIDMLQTADRQFAQGYAGVFAGSTATFDNIRLLKTTTSCRGLSDTERCFFTCGSGLVTKGPTNRTCVTDTVTLVSASWFPALPAQGSLSTDPNNMLCTLDPPEFPLASVSVPENSIRGANVGSPLMASSTSAQYPVQYLITAQFPNDPFTGGVGTFSIDFCSGQVKVAQPLVLDFEARSTWVITVRAFIFGFDRAETYRNITVSILNVDETPIIIESVIFLPENTASKANIGASVWWDPENSSVTWTLDVDGGYGRFSLNSTSSAITVASTPTNSSGSLSMFTGSDAPLNYETATSSYDLVLVAQQKAITPDTVNPPVLSTLRASGKVRVQLTDSNDPPIIYNSVGLSFKEIDATAVPFLVGGISIIDEDMGQFNSTIAYSLLPIASYATNCVVNSNAVKPLSDGMFSMTGSGVTGPLVTLEQIPGTTAPIAGATAWRYMASPYPFGGSLVRTVYTLCVQASDGFGGVTTAPVTVSVIANIVNQPVVANVSIDAYATTGNEVVTFLGRGFTPAGAVAPPRAWYSNGLYSYNATGCVVINDGRLTCITVAGIGKDHVWTIWWDESKPVIFEQSILVSYIAPVVSLVTGSTSLSTVGNEVVVFSGTNFGPPNTPVTISYGKNGLEFACSQVLNATDSHTTVRCTTSAGSGQTLPWELMVGGQVFASAASTFYFGYANPSILAITLPIGTTTYTLTTLSTAGKDDFVVNGTNFGPSGTLANPMYGITVSYGGASGNLLTAANCRQPTGAAAHTSLICKTVPGVGTLHKTLVSVAGVSSDAPYPVANTTGLSYLPPVITAVRGEGTRNADTAGGQVFYIEGSQFGPSTYPDTVINWVHYGHLPLDTDRYSGVQCRITGEPPFASQITCVTDPGVGALHALCVMIGGQTSPIFNSAISYGAPQVSGFSGTGATDGDTVGNEAVIISGRNFGPADSYTMALLNVSYGNHLEAVALGGVTDVSYVAASCTVTAAHVQLTCYTAEGAGTNLQWVIVIDSLVSTQPTTTYAAPVITAITDMFGASVTAANVDGGDMVKLAGSFFGPPAYKNSGLSLIQSITYGRSGTEYVVSRANWQILSHSEIRVQLSPGTGTDLFFRVTVADQLSTYAPAATFSFAIPSIDALVPSSGPTYSNPANPYIVTAITRNLPLRDPLTRITLWFGNAAPVLISAAAFPNGDLSITAATNSDGTINVTFPLPVHGGGLAQAVYLELGPYATSKAYTTIVTNTSAFLYNDPVVSSVVVTKARFLPQGADPLTAAGDVLPCPTASGWGWDASFTWSCSDARLQRLEVMGRDFTSDDASAQDGVKRVLSILIDNSTIQIFNLPNGDVYITGGEKWNTATEVFILKWTHTSVVAIIRRQSGIVKMSITSPPFWDSQATIGQTQSVMATFLDVSPEISSIVGDATYPTIGGTVATAVTLNVENIASADSVRVEVGGNNATLINPLTSAPFADAAAVKSYITTLAADPSFTGVWPFNAVVPPGQGSNIVVRLFRIRGVGEDGSNTGRTINYAAPDLVTINVQDTQANAGAWGGDVIVDAFTRIVVGTEGTARIRMKGSNFGPFPEVIVGDSFILNTQSGDVIPCAGTAGTHTCYEFTTPAGEGDGTSYPEYQASFGFKLLMQATDQQSRSVRFGYRDPVVSAVSGSSFPTIGGVAVTVSGKNFGITRLGRPDSAFKVEFGRVTEATSWLECTNPVRVSHTMINCTLPEGSGRDLSIRTTIAEITSVSSNIGFGYNEPQLLNITISATGNSGAGLRASPSPFTNPFLVGATVGGDIITISGNNFGKRDNLHCAFFTWAYRSDDAARTVTWDCNNGEDWLGEGEVSAIHVQVWTHTLIVFSTPAGLGVKELQLSIRGNTFPIGWGTDAARANNIVFKYLAPTLTDFAVAKDATWIQSSIDTDGGNTIRIRGFGFGATPIYSNETGAVFATPVDLSVASSLPMAQLVVVFHRACIAAGKNFQGLSIASSMTVNIYENAIQLSKCSSSISQDENTLQFRSGPGIGRNRNMSVIVIDKNEQIESTPLSFDYFAPVIDRFNPNPVALRGENPTVIIAGRYFGDKQSSEDQHWTDDEKKVTIQAGGVSCHGDPFRRGDPNAAGGLDTVLICELEANLVVAGFRNVTMRVAGQDGYLAETSGNALLLGCAYGFYAHAGEVCVPCPAQSDDPRKRGAECLGYVSSLSDPRNGTHTYPKPAAGWFNLNASDSITGVLSVSMMSACPEGFQDHGRDVCIVPCDPAESCLGDNFCAYGYTSKAPMFRCADCDKGFYKRAGQCIKCPDSPAGLFIGFILLVIFVCAGAFQLNKKQVNIAVVSIGVDFFQVLAIFSQSRIQWPPVVKELLHVLSAFNLNIEIVAPECLIPDVSYKQKFWFIMILPLSVGAIFAINYGLILFYKVAILGQEKKTWHSHSPALISSCLILVYMLYLYLTRTIFDVFNCTPTMPPDGYKYLQVVFERCGVEGGTQLTLLPFAIAALAVYTAGYPTFIAYTLYKNRETVMEDQLLRAKGSGVDMLTGPRTYKFRLTYGRSYFQFKPDYCLWILAIIIRKFFIALTAVVFNKNASFQMAACLLIVFLSYAAQAHVRPYMSPASFEDVLKSHVEASYTSALHARLRSALANIETRSRKKVRKNILTADGKVDRSAVFGVLTSWLFEYNTIEEIMLFAAVIVCLMGIMFQANEENTYYPESKDSVTAVVLMVIIAAIVYFVVVLVTEIVIMYNEEDRARRLAKAAQRGRGTEINSSKKKISSIGAGGDDGPKGSGKGRLVGEDGDINTGKLDSHMNPLFMNTNSATGTASVNMAGGENAVEAIMAQRDAPSTEVWRMFQTSYAELNTQIKELQTEISQSRRAAAEAEVNGSASSAADETAADRSAARKKTAFAPKSAEGLNAGQNPLAAMRGSATSGRLTTLKSMKSNSKQ